VLLPCKSTPKPENVDRLISFLLLTSSPVEA
jgi:hypothetical protein